MTPEIFLERLQQHAGKFADAVATREGEWIVKGFIDIYRRIYTVSVDTKIISKVLELLLFPMFVSSAKLMPSRLNYVHTRTFIPISHLPTKPQVRNLQ